MQSFMPNQGIKFFEVQTRLGGGNELVFIVAVSFFFASRSKFFYYLAMFAFDKGLLNFYKLAYAEPRPYMIDSLIKPYTCSTEFG